jgi:hypothetical protein
MNIPVFKAFLYDLITTVLTLVVAYLTVPENVSKLGFSDVLVPVIVGIAGAAALALRRYRIINKT